MSTHKKEPWSIREYHGLASILDAEGKLVISAIPLISARRIVACVNACAGIETEVLEVTPSLEDVWANVTMQRDELLTALKSFMALDKSFTTADADLIEDAADDGCQMAIAVILARNAIAKAEAPPHDHHH